MGAHVGASRPATGRTRLSPSARRSRYPGILGWNSTQRPSTGRQCSLAAAIARYKGMRDTLHHGTTWLGPDQTSWYGRRIEDKTGRARPVGA